MFWRIVLEGLGERAQDLTEGMAREDSEQFRIDARDFLSAREHGGPRAPGKTSRRRPSPGSSRN
jgi:hypothetical protein